MKVCVTRMKGERAREGDREGEGGRAAAICHRDTADCSLRAEWEEEARKWSHFRR